MEGIALVSGGKDSVYSLIQALRKGIRVKSILTVLPPRDDYVFHHPNAELVRLQAEALKIPWIPHHYEPGTDYVEFLQGILEGLDAEVVLIGSISSSYQRRIMEEACGRLGLSVYSPLWGLNPHHLMKRYLASGMKIMVTRVSALGLDESWLGKTLDQASIRVLRDLSRKIGLDPTGEGGEMETYVLDIPAFTKRIRILDGEKIWLGDHGYYHIKEAILEEKVP